MAPENTLIAMQTALSYGFSAVEFDVMLSKDLFPVLMHDEVVGRTIQGDGQRLSISDYYREELCEMDAGCWFSDKYAERSIGVSSVKVPTYESILEFCNSNSLWMNIEIKPAPGFEALTGAVVAQVTKSFLDSQGTHEKFPLFSSFSFEALLTAAEVAPEIPRAFLMETLKSDWRQRMVELNAVALHIDHKSLTRETATEIKDLGYNLFCYTVNDVERAIELKSWGVESFCTDRLDLFKDFLS